MTISAAFSFAPHYVEVEGVRLHYVEQGTGDPILFLHGNPTWSYVWRNIIPIVATKGRCIALDLVGFGKSDKPDIAYNYFDHVRYVEGFIRALKLTNVTLVLQDWGGAFGFDYALRHRDNVKAIAFFEAVSFTFTWDTFPQPLRETFKAFRTPGTGRKLICDDNMFVEGVIPGGIVRQLSEEEMNQYRMPFPTVESRKPVWVMPNMIPFSDRQDETYQAIKKIEDGLHKLTMPTLLLWAHPGAIVNSQERVNWFQQRLPALEVVDLGKGIHYLQEDHPEEIGHAIGRWLEKAAYPPVADQRASRKHIRNETDRCGRCCMHLSRRESFALLASASVAAMPRSTASAHVAASTTQTPAAEMVDTRIGALAFELGVPTPNTVAKLYDEMDFQLPQSSAWRE